MIFFVDHQAELFAAIDCHATGTFSVGMFARDELAFDKELAIDRVEIFDIEVSRFGEFVYVVYLFAKRSSDCTAILFIALLYERIIGQVSRKPNAATYYDI